MIAPETIQRVARALEIIDATHEEIDWPTFTAMFESAGLAENDIALLAALGRRLGIEDDTLLVFLHGALCHAMCVERPADELSADDSGRLTSTP